MARVEHRECQARDVLGVTGDVIAPLGQLDGAAAPHVGDAIDLRNLSLVAPDIIEHEAFAKGEVAQGQLLCPEPAKDRIEQYRAGHDKIGAAWIEAGHLQATFEVAHADFLPHASQLFGRDAQVPQLRRGRAAGSRGGDDPEAQDGARRTHDPVKADCGDLVAIAIDLVVDVPLEPTLVSFRHRIAFHEPLCQTDGAQLETARQVNRSRSPVGDLDTAATDVDHDGSAAAHIDSVDSRLMDETSLVRPGNHHRADARLVLNAREEFPAIPRFTRRACGHADDLLHPVRVCQSLECRQRLDGGIHRLRGQGATVQASRPKANHRFFPVNDFERQIGPHIDDDHVYRVGPDIYGGDTHAG